MSNKHDYHLVDPSPWPIIGASAGFLLTLGTIFYLHPNYFSLVTTPFELLGIWLLLPGALLIILTMIYWWKDVIIEALEGHHKPIVQLGLRYGMILFILSEVMFFSAFFWAFFNASLPLRVNGLSWPPEGVQAIETWDLPFINTIILLLSSTTITWAHQAAIDDNRRHIIIAISITLLLGLCFTAIQVFEYAHASFNFGDGIFSSTFYMATGFHGAHVVIGSTFIFVCLIRAIKGQFKPNQHFGLEAAAWYWHFVDVVWLFLFTCVYWWGG